MLLLPVLFLFLCHSAACANSSNKSSKIKETGKAPNKHTMEDGKTKATVKKDHHKETIIIPPNGIKNKFTNDPNFFKFDEDIYTKGMGTLVKSVFEHMKGSESIEEIKSKLRALPADHTLQGDLTHGFKIKGPKEQVYAVKVRKSETEGSFDIGVTRKGLKEKAPSSSKGTRHSRSHSDSLPGIVSKGPPPNDGKSHHRKVNSVDFARNKLRNQLTSTNSDPGAFSPHHHKPQSDTNSGGKPRPPRMATSDISPELRQLSLNSDGVSPSMRYPRSVKTTSSVLGKDISGPSISGASSVYSPDLDQRGKRIPNTGTKFKVMAGLTSRELPEMIPRAVIFKDAESQDSSQASNNPKENEEKLRNGKGLQGKQVNSRVKSSQKTRKSQKV